MNDYFVYIIDKYNAFHAEVSIMWDCILSVDYLKSPK